MTRTRRAGRAAGIAVAITAAALLAGCSADPDLAVDRAEQVFDGLVAEASALDAQTLRTVAVEPRTQEACGDDDSVVSVGFTATATLPVTASAPVIDQVADDLIGSLDAELWRPITTSADLDQRAVQHEDGTVATVTTGSRLLVIAVFSPCQPMG